MTDTTVRGAVAKRDEAPSPLAVVRQRLDTWRPVIRNLLPAHVTEQHFTATVANAVRGNDALLKCHPDTILGAALRCAQIGLAPNDGRNHAWIIPYGSEAKFQLGYGGVLELARRAEPGVDFEGHAVYPNDEFDIDYGSTEPLRHRPAVALRLDRGGPAFAWYVLMRRPDGSKKVHVLDREGVEYHRAFSKMQNGDLWKKSYDAAALKSVVLDMRRWLPQSSEMALAFASDESTVTVEQLADDPEAITTDAIDVGEATLAVEP